MLLNMADTDEFSAKKTFTNFMFDIEYGICSQVYLHKSKNASDHKLTCNCQVNQVSC